MPKFQSGDMEPLFVLEVKALGHMGQKKEF